MLESVIDLPFNQHVGIQKSSTDEGLLELPAGEQYLNHIGTVHACAQFALAEACSGEFLLRALANQSEVVPVVRRVEGKFKRPARGRITAKANTPQVAVEQAISELEAKGRCLVSIGVDIYDEQGNHSLSSSFEWFIARGTNK
ncbi:MAG: YiiD C-terminal domain-containing protein [Pirellula sp.]